MKKVLTIDLNTDRDPMIIFNKPVEGEIPTTKEEMSKMVIEDIAMLAEALAVMIKRANENGIGTLEHFINATTKTLNSLIDGTEEKS